MFGAFKNNNSEEKQNVNMVSSSVTSDNTTTNTPPIRPFSKNGSHNPFIASIAPVKIEPPKRVVDIPNYRKPTEINKDSNKRLVIGKNIHIAGEIKECEQLIVEGKVDASSVNATSIEVTEGGLFKGSAEVDSAIIKGTFEGTIVVKKSLHVFANGKIEGTIRYNNIIIESGGKVSGTIELIVKD